MRRIERASPYFRLRRPLAGPAVDFYIDHYEIIEDNRRLGRRRLTIPVLAVDGERGFPGGPQHAMRLVADDVRPFTVPDSGHYPAEERPQELAAEMLAFFKSIESPTQKSTADGPVLDCQTSSVI